MSEHSKPDLDETGDERAAVEPRQARLEGVPRRKFLGSILVGAAAGGALLPWSSGTIATANAAPAGDPLCGPGDVPWDANPFDPAAVIEAAKAMASFPFSDAARANLAAIAPIAERWAAGGARALDDKELAAVFELGWLPTAEVNRDRSLRREVNDGLRFRNKEWAPRPDNQDQYESPIPRASRARLERFEAGVDVQGFAVIIIGILIVILVVDFPTPAK
jgi:hypothetical protein